MVRRLETIATSSGDGVAMPYWVYGSRRVGDPLGLQPQQLQEADPLFIDAESEQEAIAEAIEAGLLVNDVEHVISPLQQPSQSRSKPQPAAGTEGRKKSPSQLADAQTAQIGSLSALRESPERTGPYVPEQAARVDYPAMPGYEIISALGRGGMGVVYQTRQVSADPLVDLKRILAATHETEADLARFHAASQAVARLQHPNIVQIFEVGEHNGLPFFSLEFCPGGSLEKKLAGTPLPPAEAARF